MKMRINIAVFALICVCLCSISCEDQGGNAINDNIVISVSGLPELIETQTYVLWLLDGSDEIFIDEFQVNFGQLTKTTFSYDKNIVQNAAGLLVTIETLGQNPIQPSSMPVLTGAFDKNGCVLSTNDAAILPSEFGPKYASYQLRTPTDLDDMNETTGLWFVSTDDNNELIASLDLPALNDNWIYEAWLSFGDSTTLSLGQFETANTADDSNEYSATTGMGLAFPGEDILLNLPDGFNAPSSLSQALVYVTIEPKNTGLSNSFQWILYQATVPRAIEGHTDYQLIRKDFPTAQGIGVR